MCPVDQINVGNGALPVDLAAGGQQPLPEAPVELPPEGEIPAMETLDGRHRITAAMFREGEAAQALEASKGSALKRVLLGIFTFGIYTAVKHCSRKNLARDVVDLKNQLKTLNPGEEKQFSVRIGGDEVLVHQREDNVLTARIDGEWYKVGYTAGQLVDKLERDIVTHPGLYGRRAACGVLPDVSMQGEEAVAAMFETGADQPGAGASARLRSLSLAVLSSRFGIDETKTFAVTTKLLNHYAHQVLLGNVKDKGKLEAALDRVTAGAKYMTDSQADLEVILDYESAMRADKAQVAKAVNMPTSQRSKALVFSRDQATKQQLVHDFIADLVHSSRSWDMDLKRKQGERMRGVLKENAAIIAALIDDRGLLSTLPEPIRDVMNPALDKIKGELDGALGKAGGLGAFLNTGAMRTGAIAKGIQELPDSELERMEGEIAVSVFNASLVTQEEFNRLLDKELGGEPENGPANGVGNEVANGVAQGVAQEGAPVQGKQPAQTKPTLDDALKGGGADGNYFKFMKQVLRTYFQSASLEDQRAMFAAGIRYSTDGASPAAKLGALLKGAGPIMQKMLQGFNTTGMSEELKDALRDMKSNLAPIHEDVVRAHLLNMVQASHGKITKIDVVKILGAASVGQVMQCKVHMADGTEKDCVVKIRRPDVLNRAQREREIFEKAAKEVPGMEVTFAGQLERIMDEMDLTIEAKNVKAGQIYGRTEYNDVGSMKLFADIEPTASTMVLEKAPGATVDKYLDEVGKEVDALINAAVMHDKEGEPLRNEDGQLVPDSTKGEAIFTAVQRLNDICEDLLTRQAHVANLSKVWVEEGIFKEGFYHGDLHAGNIMVDDKAATFIDFGNATKLTEDQQKHVMIMMLAAGSGQSAMFADSYRALLTKDGRARFDSKKDQIKPFLEDIFARGTREQAGKRIAAALKGLQDMGLELPAPIFNFSQCQQRLEGTVDGINALIRKVEHAIRELAQPANDYSLDKHILKVAFRGGTDPLRNAKEVIIDDRERGSFRWFVEEFCFATKYGYKEELFPALPQSLKEKYPPEVMFPGIEGTEEMLEHRPDEALQAEFWRDVEAYIEETRQKFTGITKRLTEERLRAAGEEPESVMPMYLDITFHAEDEELPNFFTLMSTVISGYLSSGLKRAAFAMKIGVVNSWRLS